MKTWNSPIVNALKTSDAIALQQIFASLSQEIGRINDKIEQMQAEMATPARKDYQRIK
jgi:hypothetical protein|tara:strand:- start:53 stop:226 length:174 start_codon:yes stop_codon:yes gene_type:complete